MESSEYVDTGVSGSKESRPQLDKLMQDVERGKIDVVWCGSSTASLVA